MRLETCSRNLSTTCICTHTRGKKHRDVPAHSKSEFDDVKNFDCGSLCSLTDDFFPSASQGETVASHPDQGCAQAPLAGHAHGGGCQRKQPGVGDAGRSPSDCCHPTESADPLCAHGASR